MKTKLQQLRSELEKLPHSLYAGHIAGNSKATQFTGNFQGNWISKGYVIWDSMNIVFAGTYDECLTKMKDDFIVMQEETDNS